MRAKVTERGILIPKSLLEGVSEVEISKEQNLIIVKPVTAGDPILDLGTQPIVLDVEDASVNHDRYLYGR